MDTLGFTVSDAVATLSIQRPAVSNAIDITIIRAIHTALDRSEDPGGAPESALRNAPVHGSVDPAAQRFPLSDRGGGQWRGGGRGHEPRSGQRSDHCRREF